MRILVVEDEPRISADIVAALRASGMAVDAVELSIEMRPDVVVLVTGDADIAHLAIQLRRRGIRVEVASTASTLGAGLKTSANEVIDISPLLETFEPLA